MNNMHSVWIIAVAALVTAGLRFLPFWIFGKKTKTPEIITHLAAVLPYAVMGMLVVYCLKDVSDPYGLPEFVGCAAVVILHVWKRSTLLSIGGGTAVYMLLLTLFS